jgi:hypothetical protein
VTASSFGAGAASFTAGGTPKFCAAVASDAEEYGSAGTAAPSLADRSAGGAVAAAELAGETATWPFRYMLVRVK